MRPTRYDSRSLPRRSLRQPDQVAFRVGEAGDDAAIGDGMRPEGFLPAFAFDQCQRGGHVFNPDIKRDMLASLAPAADAAADARARVDQRIASMAGVICQSKMDL